MMLGGGRFEQLAVVAVAGPLAGPGLDGALVQRLAAVGHDQVGIDFELGAQAGAGRAGAMRAVEGEGAWLDLGQADAAVDAGKVLGEEVVVRGLLR